jgi:Erv1 / Alr family
MPSPSLSPSPRPLDPTVWGPPFWFFLHTIALHYPLRPSTVQQKKMYEFFQTFPAFLPDPEMGEYFERLMSEYPLTPYLDDRDSLVRWVHFIHNKINARLDKPALPLSGFYELYYEKYKPPAQRFTEHLVLYKKLLYILIVLMLGGACYYMWRYS